MAGCGCGRSGHGKERTSCSEIETILGARFRLFLDDRRLASLDPFFAALLDDDGEDSEPQLPSSGVVGHDGADGSDSSSVI